MPQSEPTTHMGNIAIKLTPHGNGHYICEMTPHLEGV